MIVTLENGLLKLDDLFGTAVKVLYIPAFKKFEVSIETVPNLQQIIELVEFFGKENVKLTNQNRSIKITIRQESEQ